MRTTTEIKQIEQALGLLGLKPHNVASAICRRAKIDATTYRRWRNGETNPNKTTWDRVLSSVARIEKEVANGKHVLAKRRRRKAKSPRR